MRTIAAELCAEYNINVSTIYKLMHKHGVYKPIQRQALFSTQRMTARNAEIVEAYDNGKSIADISRETGLTRQRVHQIVRRDRPELEPAKTKRDAAIVAAYEQGKSIKVLSLETGLTRQRVQQIVRKDRTALQPQTPECPDSHAADHAAGKSDEFASDS